MEMRRLARLFLAGWLATSGCRGPALWEYEKRVEETPPASVHAVHQERLEELMGDLDRLRNERLSKSYDVEIEERRSARAVAEVAAALASSAAQIPAAAPPDLDDRERAEFLALARELEQRTLRLADQAERLGPAQRDAALAEIDATCSRCHRRFRIPRVNDELP
jgi:cytochrome c556